MVGTVVGEYCCRLGANTIAKLARNTIDLFWKNAKAAYLVQIGATTTICIVKKQGFASVDALIQKAIELELNKRVPLAIVESEVPATEAEPEPTPAVTTVKRWKLAVDDGNVSNYDNLSQFRYAIDTEALATIFTEDLKVKEAIVAVDAAIKEAIVKAGVDGAKEVTVEVLTGNLNVSEITVLERYYRDADWTVTIEETEAGIKKFKLS